LTIKKCVHFVKKGITQFYSGFFSIGLCFYTINNKYSHNNLPQPKNELKGFVPLRVAHAGGAIDGNTYTNSYEALDENSEKGYRYFEIDFLFTSDKKLVCLHKRYRNFKNYFGFMPEPKVSIDEFKKLQNVGSAYTNCTLDGLAEWMKKNPSSYVVTDVKDNNLEALKMIHSTLPDANRRVIPQIYYPKTFYPVKELGFKQVIWTLYRVSRMRNDEVIDWALQFSGPIAITMPKIRAKSTLPKLLAKLNIPTYVHTINSPDVLRNYFDNYKITEVYTDFLHP